MSARRTTVAQLREMLEQYPDDMCVVSVHPQMNDWNVEGTVSGVQVSELVSWEVRTGWHVLHPSEAEVMVGGAEKLLLIHDFDPNELLDWQDEVLEGPSPYAEAERKEE